MKKLHARFKLWLNCGHIEGAFGDGKWRLLEAIDREGSLQAASSSLHISYRKAWGDLNKAQQALGVALVAKHRGGRSGGRTALTADGRKWLRAYTAFRREIEAAVAAALEKYFGESAR